MQQVIPELADRCDFGLFIRRVRIADRRSERDHVEVRVLAAQDTALQSGVDRHDSRLAAVKRLVRFGHRFQDRRIHIGIPARVTAARRDDCPGQRENRSHRLSKVLLLAVYRTAKQRLHSYRTVLRYDACEVGRGLYQPGHRGAHADHPVGAALYGIQQPVLAFCVHDRCGHRGIPGCDRNAVIDPFELGADQRVERFNHLPEGLEFFLRDQRHGCRFARDRIAQLASVD